MAPTPQGGAAEDPFTSHDSDGSVAGAAGTSTGGVSISREALVAIIVVVVVVALFGSKSSSSLPCSLYTQRAHLPPVLWGTLCVISPRDVLLKPLASGSRTLYAPGNMD